MSGRAHGSAGRYNKDGCRCDVCTDAATERWARGKAKRLGQEPPEHGANGYRNWGCMCDVCRQGNRDRLNVKQRAAGKGVNARKEWTSAEIEVALERIDSRRYARTALEAALELGRSVSAVNRQRTMSRVNSRS